MISPWGFDVGKDSVHRVWQEEGLQVPQKQPKRSRLWLTDGSCIRLRPTHKNPVWSYDFVSEQTHDGRKFRILSRLNVHLSKKEQPLEEDIAWCETFVSCESTSLVVALACGRKVISCIPPQANFHLGLPHKEILRM